MKNKSVKLADPGLGNIEMSKEEFNGIYGGNAIIIDPDNITRIYSLNRDGTQINKELTIEELQTNNGRYWQIIAGGVLERLQV